MPSVKFDGQITVSEVLEEMYNRKKEILGLIIYTRSTGSFRKIVQTFYYDGYLDVQYERTMGDGRKSRHTNNVKDVFYQPMRGLAINREGSITIFI